VRVVCGDLTRERFGLDARAWDALAERVDVLCHNAALVKFLRESAA